MNKMIKGGGYVSKVTMQDWIAFFGRNDFLNYSENMRPYIPFHFSIIVKQCTFSRNPKLSR